MAAAAPRWNRLEHDERREQILACARRLFSERHYGAVSTSEIARESGVARGLLHHYFGTKRDLYLEVVRSMVRLPPQPLPEHVGGRPTEELLGESIDRWLGLVQRNRQTWFAALGAGGFGDPEVEAILEAARDGAAEQLVAIVAAAESVAPSRELRALLRSYSGLAEAATWEWLVRRRLTREQTRVLLTDTLVSMVRDVLPEVVAARALQTPKQRTPA